MTTVAAGAPVAPDPSLQGTDTNSATFPVRFVEFWWVRIPATLRAYSTLLWAAWSDGLYLTAWPRLAVTLVFAVFLFGFAEGLTHWSYRTIVGSNGFAGNVLAPMATANDWGGPTHLIFADNLVLLMVAVLVGTASANLGVTLVIGYLVGDILHGPPATGPGWRLAADPFNAWIYQHVPLLTTYVLFFLLASLPILMAIELTRSSHHRVVQSKLMAVGLTAVIQAALIYCWGCWAPMVFRTVQLWSGGDPRITVPFYSQITATWLVPTAVLAVLARALLFSRAVHTEAVRNRIQTAAIEARGRQGRTPQWVAALIAAALITLLLTGFMHTPDRYAGNPLANFIEAEVIFLALAAALLLSIYRLPRMGAWNRWVEKVEQYPAVLRIAAATIATYLLCLVLVAIPGLQSSAPGEFGPEVTAILVGLALTIVLLPHGWLGLSTGSRIVPWRRVPVPSPAVQTAIIGALVLAASKKAFGDCYDCACCFTGCLPGVAAAAAAGGIPVLGGTAGPAKRPIAKKDPCAAQAQAMKDAQNLADSLKAQAHAYQAAMQADAAHVKADQTAADAAYSALKSLLSTLANIIDTVGGWPSNPADFTNQQLQSMESTYGHGPYAQQVADLVNAVQKLQADMAKLTNDTNNYNNLCEQYRNAYSAAAKAKSAYWDCVISHGGVAPLGAPPPPSLAHPLGAPPAPKPH